MKPEQYKFFISTINQFREEVIRLTGVVESFTNFSVVQIDDTHIKFTYEYQGVVIESNVIELPMGPVGPEGEQGPKGEDGKDAKLLYKHSWTTTLSYNEDDVSVSVEIITTKSTAYGAGTESILHDSGFISIKVIGLSTQRIYACSLLDATATPLAWINAIGDDTTFTYEGTITLGEEVITEV